MTVPFVPGTIAGGLIWRQNCNTAVGGLGCIPPAPIGNRDYVSFCSKSDLLFDITTEVNTIAGINSCVRVPAEREVTGAVGTITGCRVQDASLLELIAAAEPVIWNDLANPPPGPLALGDEVGYRMNDFGSVGCQTCGGGCDYFSALLWCCAFPLRGCQTALPRGVYAVVAIPSFRVTQPADMKFGGPRDGIDASLNFTMDVFDISPNIKWYPCTSPDVVVPQRGPIFPPAVTPILPDILGLQGSPLAVFLSDIGPPTDCDCCGAAGFWDDGTGGGGGGGFSPDAIAAAANDPANFAKMEAIAAQVAKDAEGKTPEQLAAEVSARVAAEKKEAKG